MHVNHCLSFFPDNTRTLAHPEFHHTPYVLLLYSILLALYLHIFQIISILYIQCTFRFNPMLTISFLHIPSYILLVLSEFEFLLPKVYPSIILSERVCWWQTSVFIWKRFYLNQYLRQSHGHALSPVVRSEVWPWTKIYGPGFLSSSTLHTVFLPMLWQSHTILIFTEAAHKALLERQVVPLLTSHVDELGYLTELQGPHLAYRGK